MTSASARRSSSPSLFARAWSEASAQSSSVAMAAAAQSGFALKVPAWATRWLRSQSGSPRKASMPMSSRLPQSARSEERRVGKECRSRWSPYQAEDGIRDWSVTGVQTCALPISQLVRARLERGVRAELERRDGRRGAERVRVEGPGVGHTLAPVPVGIAAEGEHAHELALAAEREIGRASCRERV